MKAADAARLVAAGTGHVVEPPFETTGRADILQLHATFRRFFRRCDGVEKSVGRWGEAAEYPLARWFRTAAQRRDLFRLPPDARHRRLSFSRRGLDGGKPLQFNGGAGIAAFLRRPG